MVQRFHGIDRHKRSSTISVLNRDGVEVTFVASCTSFSTYVEKLGAEDAVVMEAGMGNFWWADKIESRGASCFIIDLVAWMKTYEKVKVKVSSLNLLFPGHDVKMSTDYPKVAEDITRLV